MGLITTTALPLTRGVNRGPLHERNVAGKQQVSTYWGSVFLAQRCGHATCCPCNVTPAQRRSYATLQPPNVVRKQQVSAYPGSGAGQPITK